MKSRKISCVTAAVLTAGFIAAPAMGATPSNRMCIPLMEIDHTHAVDDKTILVDMKVGKAHKRIDLVNNCPGLRTKGFAHETSINQLCKSDALRVIETAGATCMIDQIVDITEDEAKALKMKK